MATDVGSVRLEVETSEQMEMPKYIADLAEHVRGIEVALKENIEELKKEVKTLTKEARCEDYSDCCTPEFEKNRGPDMVKEEEEERMMKEDMQLNTRAIVRIKPKPLFWLKYSSARNAYESSEKVFQRKCFPELIYESENLEFNRDNNRSYRDETTCVSRYEGCSNELDGVVRWRFDVSELRDVWQRIEVQVNAKHYRGTKISLWALSYDAHESPVARIELEVNDLNTMTADQLNGGSTATVIDLVARLSGGSSWLKPHLFRQTQWRDKDEWPFKFIIY